MTKLFKSFLNYSIILFEEYFDEKGYFFLIGFVFLL